MVNGIWNLESQMDVWEKMHQRKIETRDHLELTYAHPSFSSSCLSFPA
jgi:hypothetical protein